VADLTFVQGDTQPSIYGALTNSDGTAKDLTSCTVRFQMRRTDTFRYKVDAAAVVVTPATGSVRYDLAAGDLDEAGDYLAYWQITYPDNTIQHTLPENTITVDPA
jgi:hypothetical protein